MREMDKYLKTLENGNKVFDYNIIDNENFPINIIISERGQLGKTFGLKELLFEKALKNKTNKIECLYLRSQSEDVKNEMKKFLDDIPNNMKNYTKELKVEKKSLFLNKKKLFSFGAVSTPNSVRGSRTIANNIVWDEFNDSIKLFRKDLKDNTMNIISSSDNPQDRDINGFNNKKFWLLGNNKGLNHPLIINLGIDIIEKEVTKIYDDNGNNFILLLCPIYNENDIKTIDEKNKNDWIYQLNKKLGTVNHIYYNQSDIDKLNFITRYFDLTEKEEFEKELKYLLNPSISREKIRLHATFLIDGNYLNLYYVPKELQNYGFDCYWHIVNIDLMVNSLKAKGIEINKDECISRDEYNNLLIHTTNKNELQEGIILLSNNLKQDFINKLSDNNITFENTTSRMNYMSLIKK